MKLTLNQVFTAHQVISLIISEKRVLPLKGSYRLARMLKKMQPELEPIAAKYDAMLAEHATPIEGQAGQYTLTPAFAAAWADFSKDEIDVDVEPIPLEQLDLGDNVAGAISLGELITLGDLVKGD